MVPSQMAWAWIQRGQQRPERRDTHLPAVSPPRPRRELPCILHLGDSRSANRQLITAWRPLAPLHLCSAKCVMEMGPKQTLLPRGTLALLSRGCAPGEPGKGLRCGTADFCLVLMLADSPGQPFKHHQTRYRGQTWQTGTPLSQSETTSDPPGQGICGHSPLLQLLHSTSASGPFPKKPGPLGQAWSFHVAPSSPSQI